MLIICLGFQGPASNHFANNNNMGISNNNRKSNRSTSAKPSDLQESSERSSPWHFFPNYPFCLDFLQIRTCMDKEKIRVCVRACVRRLVLQVLNIMSWVRQVAAHPDPYTVPMTTAG